MNMQTGFGDAGDGMAEQYIDTMINILLPVIERSTLLAAEYCKACGRDVLLPEDMKYAIKYCAMYTVGQDIGSLFLKYMTMKTKTKSLTKTKRITHLSRDTQERMNGSFV